MAESNRIGQFRLVRIVFMQLSGYPEGCREMNLARIHAFCQ